MARWFYRLFEPLRARCEAQCLAALGERFSLDVVKHTAEQSFVHRSLNLADLLLADRRMRADTYERCGGRIPAPWLGMLLDLQSQRRPVILVTAYYGPFDLLPLLLGYNGIRACAVYRPHANRSFDAFRTRIRTRSGCEAVPVERAAMRLPEVLEGGGAVAILSDHHAQRGVPVTFLGLPTKASRAVGVLAVQYDAVVVAAAIRRTGQPFRFEVVVEDTFDRQAWVAAADPVASVTERYVAALERIVLADPAQYLWAHPRWGGEIGV
jgi:KDO2-lipid IV(A) lauroyltransferase